MNNKFLPISREDMNERGWEQCDFIIVTGDAYVDHHSFGTAVISRVLEHAGYKVGIIAQPDWHSTEDFMKLGRPRLAFLVNAGNMDSMVNHYTVSKRVREKDLYSPGGKMGLRPDRATIVYCNKIREAYKHINICIGGVEASLRRFAHYDYWADKVRKSILTDSGADLLIYGMSEKQIVEVAHYLNEGFEAKYIRHVPGTCYLVDSLEEVYEEHIVIPSYKEVSTNKLKYCEAFKITYQEQDPIRGRTIVQDQGDKYLVVNKPEVILNREELDAVYDLPFTKEYHPIYEPMGGIPALEEVKFSIVGSRGCFGNCSFCAITFHQGRAVQSRSKESIVKEAKEMTEMKDFKGYIHDVGGPTANFRHPSCKKQMEHGVCKTRQCLFPSPCKNLDADHRDYVSLLRKLRDIPKVKKVFIRSGIRFDYLLADKKQEFLRELCEYHVSGQLKVAPEHVAGPVLSLMGKPEHKVYEEFTRQFYKMNEKIGKEQYLVPYLMSSHPGCSLTEAVELAEYLRDLGYMPEQVQDFYPTPSTISTCMYYTGVDPRTMEPVYVPKNPHEKAMQRALIQYRNPANYELVKEALLKAHRSDLIGFDAKCLIRPRPDKNRQNYQGTDKNRRGQDDRNMGGKNAGRKNTGNSSNQNGRNIAKERPTGKKKTIRNTHNRKKK